MTYEELVEKVNSLKGTNNRGYFLTIVNDDDFEHNLSDSDCYDYQKQTEEEKNRLAGKLMDTAQEYFEEEGLFGKCFRTALQEEGFSLNEDLMLDENDLTF